ncbi:MAG TPA: hypothetical protein VHD35_12710 [Chitinophagaceae bacterium]|nr:hypothetical protein [Chitinophagaceae bacterium]
MRQFFILFFSVFMLGSLYAQQAPYVATYSSHFEMGDPKNAEAVLKLWKGWADGDLSAEAEYYADTVTMYQADGIVLHDSRENLIVANKIIRSSFTRVESKVKAWVALRSTDKNENWVYIWGADTSTDKNGKTESTELFETWRFNSEGKADLMYEFAEKAPSQP